MLSQVISLASKSDCSINGRKGTWLLSLDGISKQSNNSYNCIVIINNSEAQGAWKLSLTVVFLDPLGLILLSDSIKWLDISS